MTSPSITSGALAAIVGWGALAAFEAQEPADVQDVESGETQTDPPVDVPPSADEQQPLGPRDAARLVEYFETSDYNGNGWIGFSEANAALLVDRDEFFAFDSDRDGRIDAAEFESRFRELLERQGSFPPPVPEPEPEVAPVRTAEQLRNAFDSDSDGRLETNELNQFVDEYELTDLSGEMILQQLDGDGSGALELGELALLSKLLESFKQAPPGTFGDREATTVRELFGVAEERKTRSSLPEPPLIVGPISSFDRLDVDGDGSLEPDDLAQLQFPLTLPVRGRAVLAALDSNGDGLLSPTEFHSSMQ